MIQEITEKEIEHVCNLNYLIETMGNNKHLIREIMDAFLIQIPKELNSINEGIAETNYDSIKRFAHTMKSTVSIMNISVLTPILQEMEDCGKAERNIEKIKELNQKLNSICKIAINEINMEKLNYS
jgi:HPt (histidine-containing phosphotransfer) domain-containing protein